MRKLDRTMYQVYNSFRKVFIQEFFIMTLKELWESRGLSPTQVCGLSNISSPTLYRMNRKEKVQIRTIVDVCRALNISVEEYNQLEADR